MEYFDAFARDYRAYKGGAWCYEDGCVYRGLELLHRATCDRVWLDHLLRLISPQVGPGPSLAGYSQSEYNIDHVMAGRALLYLDEVTGDPRWLDAAGLLVGQLETHPRTRSGVWWHKLRYPWQVWLDGLYMGAPFAVGYGLRTGDAAMVEDALKQVDTALEMTWVPETGLYAHAVDEVRKQPWADAVTGHNPAHWARALGWLAMALVDLRDLAGPARFAPLEARATDLLSPLPCSPTRSCGRGRLAFGQAMRRALPICWSGVSCATGRTVPAWRTSARLRGWGCSRDGSATGPPNTT